MEKQLLEALRAWCEHGENTGSPWVDTEFWPEVIIDGHVDMEHMASFLAAQLSK